MVWTTKEPVAGEDRATVDVHLDLLHALLDHVASDFEGYLARLADRGVNVVATENKGFEMR